MVDEVKEGLIDPKDITDEKVCKGIILCISHIFSTFRISCRLIVTILYVGLNRVRPYLVLIDVVSRRRILIRSD